MASRNQLTSLGCRSRRWVPQIPGTPVDELAVIHADAAVDDVGYAAAKDVVDIGRVLQRAPHCQPLGHEAEVSNVPSMGEPGGIGTLSVKRDGVARVENASLHPVEGNFDRRCLPWRASRSRPALPKARSEDTSQDIEPATGRSGPATHPVARCRRCGADRRHVWSSSRWCCGSRSAALGSAGGPSDNTPTSRRGRPNGLLRAAQLVPQPIEGVALLEGLAQLAQKLRRCECAACTLRPCC